jgi:hypothetical protein
MRSEVARLLDRKNQSFPGAQPVSFSRKHLEELTRQEYVPIPHSLSLYPTNMSSSI